MTKSNKKYGYLNGYKVDHEKCMNIFDEFMKIQKPFKHK